MYIRVKAHAGAKEERIVLLKQNEFEIFVREPAERNLANQRICELLRQYFKNPAGGVTIINGHHHPVKLLKVGNE